MDPLTKSYPHWTPYQFAGNTPIRALDLDGLEILDYRAFYRIKLEESTTLVTANYIVEKSLLPAYFQEHGTPFIPPAFCEIKDKELLTYLKSNKVQGSDNNSSIYDADQKLIDDFMGQKTSSGYGGAQKDITYGSGNGANAWAIAKGIEWGLKKLYDYSQSDKNNAQEDYNNIKWAYKTAFNAVNKDLELAGGTDVEGYLKKNYNVSVNKYKVDVAQYMVDKTMPSGSQYGGFIKNIGDKLLESYDLNKKIERESETK